MPTLQELDLPDCHEAATDVIDDSVFLDQFTRRMIFWVDYYLMAKSAEAEKSA